MTPLRYDRKRVRRPPPGRSVPLAPYLPSKALVEVVNLAIYLERPLLIKGEPGAGKTRLAEAVAARLRLPLEIWSVKSTSRARDGLYTYDTIGRLRDANLGQQGVGEGVARAADAANYVRWGPLGRAFRDDSRTVLLIDEIDKADIDFPNDLLLELDERRFTIDELEDREEREVIARHPPIVIVTSNDEKDLPDAFLRRCIFHYIEFPDPDELIRIVSAHFPTAPTSLVRAAVERFEKLRSDMVRDKGEAGKRVSTSELVDWFRVLSSHPTDEALSKLDGQLPYPAVLLKALEDHRRYVSQPA
ncbi:MoxR family ATPase [Terrabacter sp. Root181]|uniref:AAA family ATPase n=1 Tax=Terrabacter sp. Root181 TaxID=1736484 RepID=UPI00191027E7|nr:MoxR family ATPase [Terrabacter sp. Root181]